MSLKPKKRKPKKTTKYREQALRDKLHWKGQEGKEWVDLYDRIKAIDDIRSRLTESQNNVFLQIEDDFYNEQGTPAFVDQDLAALERELRSKKKKPKKNTGMKKPQMSDEEKAYWKRESKALAATEKDFHRIRQAMITAKSFGEIERLLKESNVLFLAHPSDSTARKTNPIREAANKRSKELGWTPEGGIPPRLRIDHEEKSG